MFLGIHKLDIPYTHTCAVRCLLMVCEVVLKDMDKSVVLLYQQLQQCWGLIQYKDEILPA